MEARARFAVIPGGNRRDSGGVDDARPFGAAQRRMDVLHLQVAELADPPRCAPGAPFLAIIWRDTVPVGQLEPLRRDQLQKHSDAAIRKRVAALPAGISADRVDIVKGYRAALDGVPFSGHDRMAFYDAARHPDVAILVATGDQRVYANLLLTIGVRHP